MVEVPRMWAYQSLFFHISSPRQSANSSCLIQVIALEWSPHTVRACRLSHYEAIFGPIRLQMPSLIVGNIVWERRNRKASAVEKIDNPRGIA